MTIRSLGYGKRGKPGLDATLPTFTASATGLASNANPTVSVTQGGAFSFGIPAGQAGSNATATPLGSATPKANAATGTVGVSANASREDHVHPIGSGALQLIGTVNVTETLLISLAVGMKRMTLPLAGVAVGDRLQFIPTGVPTTGCEGVNAYPASAGNVSVGYYTPVLGVGATYTIPGAVYRVIP